MKHTVLCISDIGLQATPLILAAKYDNFETISLLVDAGAQLEAKDRMEVSAWIVMVVATVNVTIQGFGGNLNMCVLQTIR